MDTKALEQVIVNAGAGIDNVFVNNLFGTDIDGITVNLSGTIGGSAADAQFDAVVGTATDLVNIVEIVGAGSSLFVTGLPALISINQADPTDQLVVNTLGGNDFISATSLNGGVISMTIDAGLGDDTVLGGQGGDTIIAGDGNDTVDANFGGDSVFLGIGNDTFIWDPGDGSDVVEGQAGTDILLFNGSNANENVTITPNGGRALLLRDVASVTMDMDDMETLSFTAFGGADNITVGNMAGTDVTKVIVNLAASNGAADGFADSVTVNATGLGDILDIAVDPSGSVVLTGLFATVEIRNFDSLDRLIINAGEGNDTIDATGVGIALTIFGGNGNDSLTGGNAFDTLDGGLGDDMFFRSPGGDLILGGGGNDMAFI
jgi:Ca2+-binding RTX toxin-like protein